MDENHETDPVTEELLAWIGGTVRHLAASTAGLTEQQLRTPVTSSGWTILGLVEHVRDSTVFWLENVVLGVPAEMDDEAWDNDPAARGAEVIERLRVDTARACEAVAHVASTASPGWWPEGAWGGYRQDEVRGVLVHLLNDNAAHTGQMDLARESIDGAVWDFSVGGVRVP
ncbi:hypothetical protein GCM10009623_20560 [Nocardioides aestuarii]|uniref:DinB family protein n=1 Tax=Nocardioides aestuarii TaxID=252231 RepID=A0ABW4TKV1_9ACTN